VAEIASAMAQARQRIVIAQAPPKRGFLLPLLASVPGVDLFLGLVFGIAIPLLQTALELVLLAIYDIKIIIAKLLASFLRPWQSLLTALLQTRGPESQDRSSMLCGVTPK
jgi:hypothetical protein